MAQRRTSPTITTAHILHFGGTPVIHAMMETIAKFLLLHIVDNVASRDLHIISGFSRMASLMMLHKADTVAVRP